MIYKYYKLVREEYTLSLSKEKVDMKITSNLIERIKDNDKKLTKIDLSGELSFTLESITTLSQALETNVTITSLYISDTNIGDDGLKPIAEMLQKNQTINALHLVGNGISSKGIEYLSKALIKNNTITHLYMGRNLIGPEGAKLLAKAIERGGSLTTLSIHDNNIQDEGAIALVKALEKNKLINDLSISSNYITRDGIKAFMLCMNQNKTLLDMFQFEWQEGDIHRLDNIFQHGELPETNLIYKQLQNNTNNAVMLLQAAKQGDIETVKNLVAQGVSLSYQDGKGNTALHYAAEMNHVAVVDYLIKQAHQPWLANKKGEYPRNVNAADLVIKQSAINSNTLSIAVSSTNLDTFNASNDNVSNHNTTPSKRARTAVEGSSSVSNDTGLQPLAKKQRLDKPLNKIIQAPDEEMSDIDEEVATSREYREVVARKEMSTDAKNDIGMKGERIIYNYLLDKYQKKYGCTAKVTPQGFTISGNNKEGAAKEVNVIWHNNQSSVYAPVDFTIEAKCNNQAKKTRYIEVKTTQDKGQSIAEIKRNQLKYMRKCRDRVSLFRVYNVDELVKNPKLVDENLKIYKDPFKTILNEPAPLAKSIMSIKVKI